MVAEIVEMVNAVYLIMDKGYMVENLPEDFEYKTRTDTKRIMALIEKDALLILVGDVDREIGGAVEVNLNY